MSDDELEIEPSELDEMTHRELGYIYDDSTRTTLFTKGIQWRTVGSTLIIFVVMVGLAKFLSSTPDFVRVLKFTIILTSMGAIFMLIIFQFWQHAEGQKIRAVERHYSSLFREIRMKKSRLEANMHRYILLTFMIVVLLAGAFVTISAIDKIG
jgi:hypothetical protein